MGQQLNKIQKRRRRADYLERKKQKVKDAAAVASKPRVRKAAVSRKAPAAPKAPAEAAPVETPAAAPAE